MIKQAAGVGTKISQQASRESGNARSAIKGLAGFLPAIWNSLIGSIPKMIRLSVALIKSKKIGDKARFILSGAVFVIAFSLAEEFLSSVAVLGLVTAMLGPISGFFAIFFVKQLKLILLAAAFFTIVHTFNSMVENDEVKKLSDELFGEKESEEFFTNIQSMYQKLKKYFDPIVDKLCSAFESIGKRKKNINPESAGDVVVRAAQKEMNVLIGWSGPSDAESGTQLPR